MALKVTKTKDPSAVALGRKGGKIGGPARAAKLTPEQRSESARKAVQARWLRKAKEGKDYRVAKRTNMETPLTGNVIDSSDKAMLAILKRLKTTTNPAEVRQLSDQLERVIFHKQFENA
ncbi:MAG: hypothetical protein ABSH49_34520 [Bryobacteraceae bacterium]|jgi:hypothetical protein